MVACLQIGLAQDLVLNAFSILFGAICTGYCHSTSAQQKRETPFLFDCEWTRGGSDAEILEVIANGVPNTQMIGFRGPLPEEDLLKLLSFLRMRSECDADS